MVTDNQEPLSMGKVTAAWAVGVFLTLGAAFALGRALMKRR